MNEIISLTLLHPEGKRSVAQLTLREDADGNCVIDFAHPEKESQRFQDHDYFDALKELRRALEKKGIKALCNGARVDAVCSGMASQMGQGLKIYVVRLGRPALMTDLVQTFDEAPSEFIGTVEEQGDFQARWIESLSSTP